jgi:hypothetical protein
VGIADNLRASDRWLSDAGYLRIRNLEVGYNLPSSGLFQRANITNARVYISGQNLLTLSKYVGLDPDVTGAGILDRGFDNGNWPASRVVSIGFNLDF